MEVEARKWKLNPENESKVESEAKEADEDE